MAAKKVQLKDNSGNKAYPVTSSECVGMSDGSGNLDDYVKKFEARGYLFAGIATPATNPGVPDGNVFYFANEPGIYTNFDGLEFENYHLSVLYNKTGTWQRLKVYDCLDSKGSSTKFPMSQAIATFYLESVMPYALLPWDDRDDLIQIDYLAKKVKVNGSYFIVKNRTPYEAMVSTTETSSVGAYETDFICPDAYIEKQVWLLAYKVEDKKLYYINYASAPQQMDEEGNVLWYPLAYCNYIGGQFHTNFQGTLYYNGVRYSNTMRDFGNMGGWFPLWQDGAPTMEDDVTVLMPASFAMYNYARRDVVQVYFDKTENDPIWENTYNVRHYLESEREITISVDKNTISGFYFIAKKSYNDDYSTVPLVVRRYDGSNWNSILPLTNYGEYSLLGLYGYGRLTTTTTTTTSTSKDWIEPQSMSFFGLNPESTIRIDTNTKKVYCTDGNRIFLTNKSGTHIDITFSSENENIETDILLYSEGVPFIKEQLWYLLLTMEDNKVYLVNFNRLYYFFGAAKSGGLGYNRNKTCLLGAGTFTNVKGFTAIGPFMFNDAQCYPSAIELGDGMPSIAVGNSLYGKSQVGNLQYEEIGEADYAQVILYGQSLSMGWECPEVITTEAIDGNYMVGDSPLINHGNNHDETLHPLIAVKWSGGGEEPIVGCVNAFSKLYRRFVNRNQMFIGSSAGEGGQSIERLSKECTNASGSIADNNYYHTEFLRLLDQTKTAVDTKSKTVNCFAILYMQGEHNYTGSGLGMTPGTEATKDKDKYKAYLKTLKDNMQADIMEKYSQAQKPLFFIYETAGHYINNKEMTINMAQIEFAQENDDVFLLHPTYPTPDYSGGHLSTNGYRWYGELMAKSLYDILVRGEHYNPVFPMNYTVSENQLIINFYVPVPPLVLDTWTKEAITNMGFRVYNNSTEVSITSVTVKGTSVVLTCTSALSGTVEVTYAGQGRSGSGNLRDSDTYHSYYSYFDDRETAPSKRENYTPKDQDGEYIYGKSYPMYNWCANFYHKIE